MDASATAELLARMFREGHGITAHLDGPIVRLPDAALTVAVDTPELQPNGLIVRLPVGVGHPAWDDTPAWDQSVGMARDGIHPVADALNGWLHNVFPVFAAFALPGSELAHNVHTDLRFDGQRALRIHYGPLAVRDFGGLGQATQRAAVDRPPSAVVADQLFGGYALPDRPIWWYSFCARMPNGPINEVTVLNGDASEQLTGISDHLPWEGHGSLKSWALAVPATGEVYQAEVPIGG
ncbi:hypothetical protein [Actinoallomurus sp. CA-150999]|uniref:hypothetical protein n=1 Tax=Actinoallomurus sp. CA-150999 TaxID=3239887 RepID=UPI003D89C2E4